MTFPRITLTHSKTGVSIAGDLVLESTTDLQVAVDGKVRVFSKTEWTQERRSLRDIIDDLVDIVDKFRPRP